MTHAEGNTDVQIVLISVAVELFHCGKETFRDLIEQFHEPINPTSPVRDGKLKKGHLSYYCINTSVITLVISGLV